MAAAIPPSVIPETQQSIESLNAEIQSIRDQISALTSRRHLLTSTLLSSPNTSLTPSATSSNTSSRLATLRSRHENQSMTSLHRLVTPNTSFAAHDPSPSAPNNGRVLGVRFENYSTRTRRFEKPYYLLLHRPWMDSEGQAKKELRVHKHSFPEWVGVEGLARQYLPEPGGPQEEGEGASDEEYVEDGEEEGRRKKKNKQDLPGLVAELRRRVASHQRREDALARLGEGEGVKGVVFRNTERTQSKFSMKGGGVTTVGIGEKGNIVGVHATDENGKRRYNVEREWKERGHVDLMEL